MIRTFADERTMQVGRGEIADVPARVARRAHRVLRQLDMIDSLSILRPIPAFTGATLADGPCAVPLEAGWRLTFEWRADHAWLVRLEEVACP